MKKKSISISEFQLAISRTLNDSTENQQSFVLTNRGKASHIVTPVSESTKLCKCHQPSPAENTSVKITEEGEVYLNEEIVI